MRQTAKRLREEDAKRWTQAAVAGVLGVSRECVSAWFNRDSTNGTSTKGTKPDARIKLSPDAKAKIVEDVWDGMSQAQVAANFGVSKKTVSNIIAKDKKENEAAQGAESVTIKTSNPSSFAFGISELTKVDVLAMVRWRDPYCSRQGGFLDRPPPLRAAVLWRLVS